MNKFVRLLPIALFATFVGADCDDVPNRPSSDETARQQQETILKQGNASVGMPAISHFREKKLLKMILELRDQEDLTTYTYVWSDVKGQAVFLCNSIGYGIPYATQYTNPGKVVEHDVYRSASMAVMPQADPNGLFSPASAEGTWVSCLNPETKQIGVVYIEPRIIVTGFPIPGISTTDPSKAPDKK